MRAGLGLIRVSKTRDGLISPELQRTAIEQYAQRSGIRIVDWREAIDESGSQARSPWWKTLDQIITEVEQGRWQAVVAWKYSRAARHRLKWAVALDRIEQAGATLESATEGVDTTTSTGRFTRGMLAELSAFEAERIGEVWKEVKQRRVSLGLADGQPRFGYTITDSVYVPNEWAETVRALYEQKVDGRSARWLTFWLQDQGAVTRYGNPYNQQGLVRMLNTGFAAGLIQHAGGYAPGAHEPIITRPLWDAYLAQRRTPTARVSSRYGLSGLLLCAYCRKPLHASSRINTPNGTLWVCGGQTKTRSCSGTQAWGPKVDRLLNAWLAEILDGWDATYQAALREAPRKTGVVKAQRRLLKIEEDLLAVADKNLRGFYDDDTYHRLRAGLLDEQRLLLKATDETPKPLVDTTVLSAALSLEGAARNEALRRVIEHVEVRTHQRPKYLIIPR